jgi:DNA-binding IclR family transcriptional regulator
MNTAFNLECCVAHCQDSDRRGIARGRGSAGKFLSQRLPWRDFLCTLVRLEAKPCEPRLAAGLNAQFVKLIGPRMEDAIQSQGRAALNGRGVGAEMATGQSAVPEETPDGEEAATTPEPFDLINKSVVKATVLLRELGRHRDGINVTELAQSVKMSRPTAFRLLLSLEQTGFVEREDNRYKLGWQLAHLGRLADPYAGAVARIQPVLDEYASKLKETFSFVMVRGEWDHEVIAEASGSRYLSASHMYLGGTYPLHASATGKLILAEQSDDKIVAKLPAKLEKFTKHTITSRDALLKEVRQVREQGYSILDDELEEGLFAVGCPVRDPAGTLIGILLINGPAQRLKSDQLPAVIDELRKGADEVAKLLA